MSQKALKNADQFESSMLQLLARTTKCICLPITSVLYRMKLGPNYCCVLCANEELDHVLLCYVVYASALS